jgi:DNA-binding transcriptional ArsR family regulator/uncharacterized protein YndB with AHSA1/START domain
MDAIFKALNDPTRRTILDRLRQKDGQTLRELEAGTGMTRFGVMKHLKVLEDAALVVSRKAGRFKYHYLNAVPLQEVIDRWIEPLLAKPAARGVLDLKAKLESQTMPKPDFVASTYIRCSPDALWDALREPELIERYELFGRKVVRDGDTLRRIDRQTGAALTTVELAAEPKSRLEVSFQPSGQPAPSRVVYLIEQLGESCKLTVEHYDLTTAERAAEMARDAWRRTLDGLKSSIETGRPIHFAPAVPA